MIFEPNKPIKMVQGKVKCSRGTPLYFWPALKSTAFTATASSVITHGLDEKWKTIILRLDADNAEKFVTTEKHLTRESIVITKNGHYDIVCKAGPSCMGLEAFEAFQGSVKVRVRIKLVSCFDKRQLSRPIISSIEPVYRNKVDTLQTCPICLEEEIFKFPKWGHMPCCGVAVHRECRNAAGTCKTCFWCRHSY